MRVRRRSIAAGLALLLTAGSLLAASPASARPSYPTWDDVQAARSDAAAAEAQITAVTDLIASLESAAAEATISAQKAAETYQVARDAEAQAQDAADRLATELSKATAQSAAATRQLGSLFARMGRSGNADVSAALLVDSTNADNALYRLSAVSKLTSRSAHLVDDAEQAANSVTSLSAQADAAATVLEDAAAEAESRLADAATAADAADARLAEQQEHEAELYAQLAFLSDASLSIEEAYLAGVAALADRDETASPAPPVPPAAPADPSTPAAPDAPQPAPAPAPVPAPAPAPAPNPTPKPSVPGNGGGSPLAGTAAARSAVAFARAQVGDWYKFAGEGPNLWDCSGLTMIAYRQAGVTIGAHTVGAQYRYLRDRGRLTPVSGGLRAGDLLFYAQGSTTDSQQMYHTTMYIGGGMMVEAPQRGKQVHITPLRTLRLVPYAGRPTG